VGFGHFGCGFFEGHYSLCGGWYDVSWDDYFIGLVKWERLTDMGLWDGEDWPVEVVEAVGCISGEFQMLFLVLANGDMCCPVISG
jgi:hypothetical protein